MIGMHFYQVVKLTLREKELINLIVNYGLVLGSVCKF